MESQSHGNIFEDTLIQNITGITKKEYEKLIKNGYISFLDLHKGILCKFNGSIKTSNAKSVGCGDILTFMKLCRDTPHKFIVANWKQISETHKEFHTVYEFNIDPSNYTLIFGDLDDEVISPFVNYVKSIPPGKPAQLANQKLWKLKKSEIQKNYNTGLIDINAKIDSKRQRRVQCSLKIDQLIDSGIEYQIYNSNYQGVKLPYVIQSRPRSFKKS